MESIITTNNLNKIYASTHALKDVSIHIPKGSIYGLVGNNGAGKTTLMRLLLGLQSPTSGEISVPKDLKKGAILEHPALYPYWSAKKNLSYQLSLIQNPKHSAQELLALVGLENSRKPVIKYSLGMKQRLGLAIALANDPKCLFLDEPLNGLDPSGILQIRELLKELNQKKNVTIIISSHILDELEKTATHVGFLKNGVLIHECPISELKNTSLENYYFEEYHQGKEMYYEKTIIC